MAADFIPVNVPLLGGNEKKYLCECIDTGWISSEGPFVKRFERQFADYVGVDHGIAVSSGSGALDIAVAALEISKDDEVIMPTFTIISCAQSVIRAGAVPVLVDSDPITWNMDIEQLKSKITPRTKAIMVVHIYGLPVDMAPVRTLADQYGIKIIEDAAEAIGVTSGGRQCGSYGDIGVVSFYPNKHITTGEGGMLLTNDSGLAERCREGRNLCFKANPRFVHEELGWNYRMTNLQAAVGVAQLEQIDSHLKRKREIGIRYNKLLADIPNVRRPVDDVPHGSNSFWIYGLVIADATKGNAADAMLKLKEKRIGTRPFFYPMHKQPVFNRMGLFTNDSHPVAEDLATNGFYIPSGLALTDDELERVAEAVHEVFV